MYWEDTNLPYTMMKLRTFTIAAITFGFLFNFSTFSYAQKGKSASDPVVLCGESDFNFDQLFNCRADKSLGTDCHPDGLPTRNGIWLRWISATNAPLAFSLDPYQSTGDLDFVLYRCTGSDLNTLTAVRCMASGGVLGEVQPNLRCLGSTGLQSESESKGNNAKAGCGDGQSAWLPAMETQIGSTWLLYVSNYDNRSGFRLHFEAVGLVADCNASEDRKADTNTMAFEVGEPSPNPAKDRVVLPLTAPQSVNCTISLIGADGTILRRQTPLLHTGLQMIELDASNLAAGTYFIQVQTDNDLIQRAFLKQ
jgi:hypothetical protein